MARRAELGAGVAAALLAILTLLAILLAPLIPLCRGTVVAGRCAGGVRMTSLVAEARYVESAVWVYVVAMCALTLLGASGAVLDARFGERRGVGLLGVGTVLAFGGCALGALGVFGLFYLPSVVALLIAAYSAYARRARGRGDAPA